MASILPGDSSHSATVESSSYVHGKLEKNDLTGASWYLSRKNIEENSPSRRDGIDMKKESYLRKSYCTFLQDLGMRLKVPQVTIATAIVFCHRFFLRQSHGKNDHRTISTVCMFLAGKVEESPRPLKDVILVSYEIIHKKDPAAIQRIKQKEVYEQQKELILLAERVVLTTLGFDLNVQHPYKPLVDAIKKFKVAQNALAQVAWNFVNDGLRTSLCLQFKSHQIAAGAIFLAAKFLKVKLPSDGERVWWQEFNVTPRQLEEVSNQMLELYEQNRAMAPSNGHETEASSASAVVTHQTPLKASSTAEEPSSRNESHECTQNDRNSQENDSKKISKDKEHANKGSENTTMASSDAIKKIDKDKVKAALERRKKERVEATRKMDVLDDDDLIERELESGIELAARGEMVKKQETNHDVEGIVEEGELHSPQEHLSGKRKGGHDSNHYHESVPAPVPARYHDGRIERIDRDVKRQRQHSNVIDG